MRFILFILITILPLTVLSHGPARIKVVESIEINAPVDKVWDLVKDFCAIKDWHPNISECVATNGNNVNSIREITLSSGEKIKEKLFKHLPEQKMMQYALESEGGRITKDLPVSTHGAKLTVSSSGDKTKVEFKGAFYRAFPGQNPPPELSDEACKKAISNLYVTGLNSIKQLTEK